MKIVHNRIRKGPNSTLSEFFLDGIKQGFIVEDTDRDLTADMPLGNLLATKVHSHTAIPTGLYKVQLRYSPKFRRVLPWIMDVPGFQYIMLHPGNWIHDTEGCPIPGLSWRKDSKGEFMVVRSKLCFDPVLDAIVKAIKAGEDVWWEVVAAY
ncbi:DUF5675 family protein [Arundinibacter roseus]|uniref:DUF5675 domain-containing protein n=1 Tax=Arundinibacter roseus TaxID=2070510 RepID=A0A4V2X9M8_9BACT|nr:DUF5675 family protein [Arundinibacter roseus]TDB64425.1 hypothetical protein EZE20_12130 [Arundinibacter roseus]